MTVNNFIYEDLHKGKYIHKKVETEWCEGVKECTWVKVPAPYVPAGGLSKTPFPVAYFGKERNIRSTIKRRQFYKANDRFYIYIDKPLNVGDIFYTYCNKKRLYFLRRRYPTTREGYRYRVERADRKSMTEEDFHILKVGMPIKVRAYTKDKSDYK